MDSCKRRDVHGEALVQNIPCQGKMRGFLPFGAPEPPRGGSSVGNLVTGAAVEMEVCELRWVADAGSHPASPASQGHPGMLLVSGCPQEAPATRAALCRGEGLCFASFLLPHAQPKYLLNFISLFPA